MYMGTFLGQLKRDASSDAARRAGDNGDFAGQMSFSDHIACSWWRWVGRRCNQARTIARLECEGLDRE